MSCSLDEWRTPHLLFLFHRRKRSLREPLERPVRLGALRAGAAPRGRRLGAGAAGAAGRGCREEADRVGLARLASACLVLACLILPYQPNVQRGRIHHRSATASLGQSASTATASPYRGRPVNTSTFHGSGEPSDGSDFRPPAGRKTMNQIPVPLNRRKPT